MMAIALTLTVALILYQAIPRVLAWRKSVTSENWPMVPACLTAHFITKFSGDQGDKFRLTVEFSYDVNGTKYNGSYVREFIYKQDAIDLLNSLEQGPFYIRHHPLKPFEHAVDPYRDVFIPQTSIQS